MKRAIQAPLGAVGLEVRRTNPAPKAAPKSRRDVHATLAGHVAAIIEREQVDCVIDVGAHEGETGRRLRETGWTGPIVSFEPVAATFERALGCRRGRSRLDRPPPRAGPGRGDAADQPHDRDDVLVVPRTERDRDETLAAVDGDARRRGGRGRPARRGPRVGDRRLHGRPDLPEARHAGLRPRGPRRGGRHPRPRRRDPVGAVAPADLRGRARPTSRRLPRSATRASPSPASTR